MTSAIVVDASVLAKVVLAEPESGEAVGGLRRASEAGIPILIAPHTRAEVGNVLVKAARLAKRKAAEVDRDLQDALLLVDVAEDPPGTAAEALRHDLSFYDATYLALAKSIAGAKVWTYDRRLGSAAKREGRLLAMGDLPS